MMQQATRSDETGAVAVEFALVAVVIVFSMLVLIELMAAFFQWNSAQSAVRTGARLASVSAPVATDIATREWAEVGDYVPDYTLTCSGATATCSEGGYDAAAMDRIIYGADGVCARESKVEKQGMCDVFPLAEARYVTVEYRSSLNEVYGAAGGLQPLITIRLDNVPLSYGLISRARGMEVGLPGASATVIAQDLTNGG